jgi:DNA N-6-adenine-methyltransferase (Dam)
MLGVAPKNHPNQRKRRGALDSVDDRETPPDVFDPLHREFRFTLDVCAARHNAKCARYFSLGPAPEIDERQCRLWPELFVGDADALAFDGLAQPWPAHETIWCNPPFSNIEPWVVKAHSCAATVVMLLPANRTEQPFWQGYIEPVRDMPASIVRTRFLEKRRVFRNRGLAISNSRSRNPPFGIVIVIWDRRMKGMS